MDGKKISFGFSKISKKPNLLPSKQPTETHSKIELIKCLEGKEIKLVVEKQEEPPLVIPLKTNENGMTPAALASLQRRRAVLLDEEEPAPAPITVEKPKEATEELSSTAPVDLEKRAAQELLAELNPEEAVESSQLAVPIVKPDDLPLEGAKQSTLDDYEAIPVQQFGMAMLRGMGFVEPPKPKGAAKPEELPFVRPKGMGLGADKALKAKPLLVKPEPHEKLEIKKQAFVRILAGKSKDLYGQIVGFDDHAGRVIVKMAIGGAKEALNEFLCQPVAKKEYADYGKCINTNKYEEYKKMENEYGQIVRPKEEDEKAKVRDLKKEARESTYDGERHRTKYEAEKEKLREFHKEHGELTRERDRYRTKPRDEIGKKHSFQKEESDYKREIKSAKERDHYKDRQPSSSLNSRYNNDASRNYDRERSDYKNRSKHVSDTDSDDDSVRKHKHSKSKLKKSKKSKKHRKRDSSASSAESSTDSSEHERTKNHKKKTKKSRRQRSRSRTRR